MQGFLIFFYFFWGYLIPAFQGKSVSIVFQTVKIVIQIIYDMHISLCDADYASVYMCVCVCSIDIGMDGFKSSTLG